MRPGAVSLLALMLLLVASARASCQTVRGSVIDGATGAPIPEARVLITSEAGRMLATVTSPNGRYELSLASAGVFTIQVSRIGYNAQMAAGIDVPEGVLVEVPPVALIARAIVLDEVTVTGRQRLTPGREWIEQRQALGKGTFFSGAQLAALNPPSLTRHLASELDMWTRYSMRGVPSLINPRSCMLILVNEWPINRTYNVDGFSETVGIRSLDDIPLDWIAAIEVYDDMRQVPMGRLWFDDKGRSHPCGVLNVWTWNSW